MDKFIAAIRKKYSERLVKYEDQWPPVRGSELINLKLVESDKTEGFLGLSSFDNSKHVKRTSIAYNNLFSAPIHKNSVRKIIVEGNAGIGKTILCQMIAKAWADGELLTQFECVIVLPLREQLVSSATSLSELFKLLHSSKNIRTNTIDELEEREGESVLIIADGWDELDGNKRHKGSFLYDLLFGSTLPLASVLLTSRPSASAPLHNLASVDRLVEVVGFNEENVRQYVKSEFKMQPEKASTLIEQLDNNPLISSICSIPLNCAIVCNLWHTMNQALPNTVTELYFQIVLNILLRDFKKKPHMSLLALTSFDSIPSDMQESFWVVCKFAYKSLEKDLLVFSMDELESLVPESTANGVIACCGLLQCSQSLLPVGHNLSFHFAHLLIQEFLAALHLATLSITEKQEACMRHARSDRFAMVWRFVFGLDYNKERYTRKINTMDKRIVDVFVQRNWHCFSQLCHCAMESNSECVTTKIATLANGHVELAGKSGLILYDCTATCHVLQYTAGSVQLSITLSGCGLNSILLKRIVDLLYCGRDTVTIVSLNLDDNQLTTAAIDDLFERVSSSLNTLQNLNLNGNNITRVPPSLSNCRYLSTLSISNNPLGVLGIQTLYTAVQTQALSKLESLTLANTFTSDSDINGALLTLLLQSIGHYCPLIKYLNLSQNNLGVPGACALGEALSLLTHGKYHIRLNLSNTQLNGEALTALSTAVNGNPSNQSCNGIVNLCGNPIDYDGLLALCRILRKRSFQITEIVLSGIEINNKLELDFGPAIEDCSLQQICIFGTNSDVDKILALAQLIRVCQFSLNKLEMPCFSLFTKDKMILLLSHLESSGSVCTKLRRWALHATVDDAAANALAGCLNKLFPRLEHLDMEFFPLITDKTKRRLEDCIESNRTTNKPAFSRKKFWQKHLDLQRGERQEYHKRRLKVSTMLDEWMNNDDPGLPRNKELQSVVLKMWEELLWEMCYFLHVMGKYPHLFGLPLKEYSSESDCFSTTNSDDEESYFSAAEELDHNEPLHHCHYATNCPEITLKLLDKELRTLTRPIQFGVTLGIPQDRIEIIQQDYRHDTDGQKLALFQFIAKNYKSLAITWSSIADALLEIHAGNLSLDIKLKYCL